MVFRINRLVYCIFIILSLSDIALAKQLSLTVSAESAILINADTGVVLYAKNAERQMYPASITKIATALYTLEVYGDKLDTMIEAEQSSVASISEEAKRRSNYTLPSHWIEVGSSHMGIKKGEILSLKDLLYGMMVASANDASNVIASFIGGSCSGFIEEVNKYVKSLGCKDTCFKNPHGLHHPKHVTTAKDMATLAKEAMKKETFRNIVKTVKYTRPKTNMQSETTLIQGNKLLRTGRLRYPKAIGIKTGYTSDAQSTLVAAATDGDRTLIAVLLKCKERDQMFRDARKMFETAFSQPKVRRLLVKAGPQNYKALVKGGKKPVTAFVEKDVWTEFYPSEEPEISCLLYWNRLKAPINKGDLVGSLNLNLRNGYTLQQVPIRAYEDVPMTWTKRLKNVFSWKSDAKEEKINSNRQKKQGSKSIWKALFALIVFSMLGIFLWNLKHKK